MASLDSAVAQETDETKKKVIVTESEFIDLSFGFRPFLNEPAKLVYDYVMKKDCSDECESPEILDELFNTIDAANGEINIDRFYEIINEILPFDSKTNKLYDKKIQKVCDGIIALKVKERLKLLSKKRVKAIPRIENTYKDLCEKYSEIQIEIREFKCKELPEAVTEMRTLVDSGGSMLQLFSYHKIIKQFITLCNCRSFILRKMEEFRHSVNFLINLTNPKTPPIDEPESGILVIRHNNNKIISVEKVNLEEVNKESKQKAKKSICRSEHNTPFCKNCSWQTSWLKNFKKKGVYIKEVDSSDTNQIWYNK